MDWLNDKRGDWGVFKQRIGDQCGNNKINKIEKKTSGSFSAFNWTVELGWL